MINPRFRVGYAWMLCLVLGLLYGSSVRAAQLDKEIERLAKAYRAARTEFDRRAVCLDAIDKGVIADLRPVADVDAIFGTTYAKKLPHGSELETGVVDFHSPLLSGSDREASGYIGWYLAFKFNSAGKLENYYLSNWHK